MHCTIVAVVEPFKASRVGVWGAVGGLAGYFGFKEQQALKAALLERQQQLEQSEYYQSFFAPSKHCFAMISSQHAELGQLGSS